MNVSKLEGAELDLAVAKALGMETVVWNPEPIDLRKSSQWSPSTNWAQGGPIIEAHEIELERSNGWTATTTQVFDMPLQKGGYEAAGTFVIESGPTQLIAAMRALVVSKSK